MDPHAFSRMMTMLASRGIPLAIASGRTYPALRRLFAPYAGCLLYFPLDGALAAAGGELLCSFPVGIAQIADCLRLLSMPGVRGVEFCTQDHSYLYANDTALATSETSRLGTECVILHSPDKEETRPLPGEPVYKIIVFTKRTSEPLPPPAGLRAVYQSNIVTELIREDVSKRRAAEIVCEALHISPEEILAYGDSENDRELLEYAGRAVTMYGAKHDLFSVTKYHTQNAAASVIRFLQDEDAAEGRKTHYGKVQHH